VNTQDGAFVSLFNGHGFDLPVFGQVVSLVGTSVPALLIEVKLALLLSSVLA
jgi:hypothetical protein